MEKAKYLTLFGKHFEFCRSSCLCVWPPRQALLDKHILLVNVFETFVKQVFVWLSKGRTIVLDKQNFKCLPNNVCSYGQGFKSWVGMVQIFQGLSYKVCCSILLIFLHLDYLFQFLRYLAIIHHWLVAMLQGHLRFNDILIRRFTN